MNEEAALDECLRRMKSGEAPEQCAADYPAYAAASHPCWPRRPGSHRYMMLTFRRLAGPSIRPGSARRLERAVASEPGVCRGCCGGLPAGVGPGVAQPRLVGLALVGSVGLATAVAASVPGEWPYTVRVVIERVPASLYVDPASRAAAELDVSERRLADLKAQLASSGQADPQALAALHGW